MAGPPNLKTQTRTPSQIKRRNAEQTHRGSFPTPSQEARKKTARLKVYSQIERVPEDQGVRHHQQQGNGETVLRASKTHPSGGLGQQQKEKIDESQPKGHRLQSRHHGPHLQEHFRFEQTRKTE